MADHHTLYLLDGSGFIFRAFHALPMLTRADGTPVNAVLGFCNILTKLLKDIQAQNIAVVFDKGRKTFRHDIYPDYKAHRPDPPPELVPQFALVREATRAFGIPAIELENYEADDLIASYAVAATRAGMTVVIVSADKDLMQLVNAHVSLLDPIKQKPLGSEAVIEKFGVPPDKVVDVQALAGDSVDHIPGVPGIGIKTAAELIVQFGDLEHLLANAHTIKQPKRRQLLLDHADMARLSKKLVTLATDVPLPLPLEQLKPDAHTHHLQPFLHINQFKSLLARYGFSGVTQTPSTAPTPAPTTPAPIPPQKTDPPQTTHYECVQSIDALKQWAALIEQVGHVVVDTETTGLTPAACDVVGIALAYRAGHACYIPLAHCDGATGGELNFSTTEKPVQLSIAQVVDVLGPLLADPAVRIIGHNLKFDWQFLEKIGLKISAYDDTMLMSYALAAGLHGHGLDELAAKHFYHHMISFDDVTGTGKNRITFHQVPLDKATQYAAEDADYTLRLWEYLRPQLAMHHVARVYETIDKPLIPVIAEMEQTGVCIDAALLRQQSNAFGKRLQQLEEKIHALAGQPFNVGSPKQLGDILFGSLGLPGGTRGKTGAYSTSSDILEPLAEQGYEIVSQVLEWRGLAKLQSTYTDALPQQINSRTGRVHTSFMLTGAATGRLSSTEPNVQNIPIRTADGKAIRQAFVAAEGHQLISVDYSQIELRLAAEIAGIAALQQAFAEGLDIHTHTASLVFNVPVGEISPDQRRAAKAINFGIIYGISAFGLSKQIGCAQSEAQQFIKDYLNRYHELRDWMDATKVFARQNGYVMTLFGRKIHLPDILSKHAPRRAFAERQAINAPMQGTAADLIKRAMVRIPPALLSAGNSAKLILQVHDELVLEAREADANAAGKIVKTAMEQAAQPDVMLKAPLVAEVGIGPNWAAAH